MPFLVHVFGVLNGYFGQDDFILTYRAAHGAVYDPGFLFQDYSGHLQPGSFFYAWLVTSLAPLNFTVAVVPLLVVHAVTLWLCWRVLTLLFGVRWAVLVPFALFAASPLILFPTVWWAYSLQLLPVLLALFGALYAQVRYLDSGAWWYAALGVLWTAVGLAFYEKAALIPAVLFAVTVFRGPREEGAIVGALSRHRWVWLGYLVVLGGYLGLYLALTDTPANAEPVSSRDVLTFVYRSVVDTFLPGLFGGPLTEPAGGAAWVTPPLVVRVGAVLVAVGVVVASVVRSRRGALLPWVFLGLYLAVDLALVAGTRLGVLGPAIGTDPRYLADVVPVAVLCGAFAFFGGNREETETREGDGRRGVGRRMPVAVVGVCVVLVAGGVASFVRVAPALQFREAREYVATARAALAEQPGMVLFDTGVPGAIMIDWFVADAFTSRVVGLVPESPRFDRPAEELYQLDGNGTPQPVINLDDPTRALPGPEPDCGYLVGEEPVRIPMEDTVSGRRIVRIGYYTGDSGEGTVTVGDTRVRVRFTEGLHVVHIVASGVYAHVEIRRTLRVAPLCVTDVTVGLPG
ncbi:glycosyltransferase family protein [Actinophytocola xanthii]|uniref:glycosyltransferase family 39 protein n=1 Tax=Actinophytocola xanthii TaxID=1912961 RepID=UPI0011783CBA|nr:glycosyltransferase family 39 protein [Actinophytocola xanthii]